MMTNHDGKEIWRRGGRVSELQLDLGKDGNPKDALARTAKNLSDAAAELRSSADVHQRAANGLFERAAEKEAQAAELIKASKKTLSHAGRYGARIPRCNMIVNETIDRTIIELGRTMKALTALKNKRDATLKGFALTRREPWSDYAADRECIREHAAAKRASMDLTRALADLRAGR